MTRAERFASLYEAHTVFAPPDPNGYYISPNTYSGSRWMLVERNIKEKITLTTEWDAPVEAVNYLRESGYYFDGEYAEEGWSIVALYDLDNGDTYRIGRNGQFAKQ